MSDEISDEEVERLANTNPKTPWVGPGGVDVTGGIPSEIYIAIGRERYEDDDGNVSEYALARDVAESVWADYVRDVIPLAIALRAARQRAREAEAKLREPRWYFDDGEWVDPDDKAAELPPGSAFRLDGARPTGTHYFRADALGSNEITEAEYTAALAAAESAAATGGGT